MLGLLDQGAQEVIVRSELSDLADFHGGRGSWAAAGAVSTKR